MSLTKLGDSIIEKEREYGEAYSPLVTLECGHAQDLILGEWSGDTLALHLF